MIINRMIIYCIKNKETKEIIYIGSTKQKLEYRIIKHLYNYNNNPQPVHLYMKINGWDTYIFEIISEHFKISRKELFTLERNAIVQYKPSHNIKLKPIRTASEKLEYRREYYSKNSIHLLKQESERSAQRLDCICGINICKGYINRHIIGKKHQSWVSSVLL